ncbi:MULTISPECIES: hypothetical protein [Microbacterium]|jgi:hypothetical protein|uniref:hypothetical protein n=1 Tax=Microbacterium TaxID=33882 RepID=UPI002783FD05|nr:MULTISPECIES: hypothetical protein [Microbacterium]MDQ1075692.1 hypothetical protein [Microbacterium sp. SORGH_AS_0969]MDQ1115934.1 hypothetical protein [Microbacterium testaceum]
MTAATFVRSWPSVSAWGAGLITAALGAGAITRPGSEAVAIGLGTGLVALGLAALAWGGVVLWAGRLVTPGSALGGSLVALFGVAAMLFVVPAHTSVLAVAAASLLLVIVGASAAVHLRRRRRVAHPERTAQPMSVVGLLVAAAVIAVVVTPALGATQNAVLLRDDGTVPVISHEGH